MLTGKHLPRRTVLKGLGATIALPLLDAMTPAGRVSAARAPVRLVCVEMVHGAAGSTQLGRDRHLWAPQATGSSFNLEGSSLASLEPFRKHLTIVSNADVPSADPYSTREIGGDHFRSSACFLTQTHPKQTAGADVEIGTSIDQLYAAAIRPGHAASLDAALHRERRSGRRLRARLLVRLHRHDQLGIAEPAAADDSQSAGRVRSDVRRLRRGRDRQRAPRRPWRRPQHSGLARDRRGATEARAGRRRPGASGRLPRQHPRDRAPPAGGRSPQWQRRAARPARRTGGRAGLLLGTRQADVRSAGAGLRLRHHPGLLVQARARQLEPRLPGERHQQRLPPGLTSWRPRRSHPRVRAAQCLSRRHGSVFPGAPRRHSGRRRHVCSTTRRSSTALRWAIPTCTITSTCRSSSPAAPAARYAGNNT